MNQSLTAGISQIMPMVAASGLFVSLATVYMPSTAQGPTGNSTGAYIAINGLENIPCMDAPESVNRPTATQDMAVPRTLAESFRHVLLDGYYPLTQIGSGSGWQVQIDGITYDLLGAESDSQRTQTRLRLQRITVSTP